MSNQSYTSRKIIILIFLLSIQSYKVVYNKKQIIPKCHSNSEVFCHTSSSRKGKKLTLGLHLIIPANIELDSVAAARSAKSGGEGAVNAAPLPALGCTPNAPPPPLDVDAELLPSASEVSPALPPPSPKGGATAAEDWACGGALCLARCSCSSSSSE